MGDTPPVNFGKIGLDRLQFYDFEIKGIMPERLVSLSHATSNVKLFENVGAQDSCLCNYGGQWISCIKITDNHIFNELIVGTVPKRRYPCTYVHLILTVSCVRGNNWNNLSWREYNEHLQSCLTYIQNYYGISLAAKNVKLQYAEINSNIMLSQPYANYDRVLRLIMSFFPNHLNKSHTAASPNCPVPTYKRGNSQMEIIFYNKTAQMQGKNSNKENDSNHYEQEILRLEICLLTAEKIKAALGTNLWAELNDQAIASLFRKMMYEQVSKKWSKWRADRRRFLVKELIVLRKAHKNDWHHLIMQEIRNKSEKDGVPFLLDIEQVTDALKTLKDPYRNRHRAIASLNAISIQDDLYHRHDLSKVEEILSAIKPCDSPPR